MAGEGGTCERRNPVRQSRSRKNARSQRQATARSAGWRPFHTAITQDSVRSAARPPHTGEPPGKAGSERAANGQRRGASHIPQQISAAKSAAAAIAAASEGSGTNGKGRWRGLVNQVDDMLFADMLFLLSLCCQVRDAYPGFYNGGKGGKQEQQARIIGGRDGRFRITQDQAGVDPVGVGWVLCAPRRFICHVDGESRRDFGRLRAANRIEIKKLPLVTVPLLLECLTIPIDGVILGIATGVLDGEPVSKRVEPGSRASLLRSRLEGLLWNAGLCVVERLCDGCRNVQHVDEGDGLQPCPRVVSEEGGGNRHQVLLAEEGNRMKNGICPVCRRTECGFTGLTRAGNRKRV